MGISALQEAVFKRLFEQAETAAFNKKELHDYRESQKDFWDLNSVIETAEKKGMEKGRVEGIAEGRAEGEAIGMQKGEHNKTLNLFNLITSRRFIGFILFF